MRCLPATVSLRAQKRFFVTFERFQTTYSHLLLFQIAHLRAIERL